MIKMLKDFTIYLPNDTEFTFRRGYSYLSEEIDGKIVVLSVDRSIRLELDEEDIEWVEEV